MLKSTGKSYRIVPVYAIGWFVDLGSPQLTRSIVDRPQQEWHFYDDGSNRCMTVIEKAVAS